MNHLRSSLGLGPLLVLCTFACFSCSRHKGQSDNNASAATVKSSPPSGACQKLADRLCSEVGRDDPTCESAGITLKLLPDKACNTGLEDFAAIKTKLEAQGKTCDDLVHKLCQNIEPDTCTMVKEQAKQIPSAQCQRMLGHVGEIVAELKAQEQANQPLTPEQQAKIAAGDAPSFGPADAKVTVVEFSDFQCPYCSRAALVTTQLKEKYKDRVRFVFRQFPLSFHPNAQVAAAASLAAHAEGKFWELHDKMFQNQGSLDRASLERYATELDLDLVKFKTALDDAQNDKRIQNDLDLGSSIDVRGTPTMFVNGKPVTNPADFGVVCKAIDEALGS